MPAVPRIIRDPSGRVTITESDDRDTAFPLALQAPINVRGMSAFVEVARLELERARSGHLLITANIATTVAFVRQFVAIDVNLIGYVAGVPVLLMSSTLDNNFSLLEYLWEPPESYTRIGLEARQNVNGAGDGDTTGITSLGLAVSGHYWR